MNPTSGWDPQEMSKITCFTDEKRPCARSKRPRLYRAPRAHMSKHVCAWCRLHTGTFRTYTRRRVEWTHGVFQRVTHHTPQHKTQHNTTTRPPHRTETETETDRDRERRQGQREKRRRKRRDKTRQDKRREKIHFQCGGAWPFFVDGVLFLVNSVCARDFSLLNSVKYDSSLISFSAFWQVNSLFKICELFLLCSYSFQFCFYFLIFLVMQLQFQIFRII